MFFPPHGYPLVLAPFILKILFASVRFFELLIQIFTIIFSTATLKKSAKNVITKINRPDFPSGTVHKNLPANAGDTGSIPGLEDSTCHRAAEPVCHNLGACALEPMHHNQRSHRNERPVHCS